MVGSADFQSAVSRISNPLGTRSNRRASRLEIRDTADWKSALRHSGAHRADSSDCAVQEAISVRFRGGAFHGFRQPDLLGIEDFELPVLVIQNHWGYALGGRKAKFPADLLSFLDQVTVDPVTDLLSHPSIVPREPELSNLSTEQPIGGARTFLSNATRI